MPHLHFAHPDRSARSASQLWSDRSSVQQTKGLRLDQKLCLLSSVSVSKHRHTDPGRKPNNKPRRTTMTDGPRQRGSASGSSGGDASAPGAEKDGGGGVALKKEIGLVSACGIIVGKCLPIARCPSLVNLCTSNQPICYLLKK